MQAEKIDTLTRQVLKSAPLTRAQADWLVTEVGTDHLPALLEGAGRIRDRFQGTKVKCCSIAATHVGRCSENCAFCSQSAHHGTAGVPASQLETEQIVQAAFEAADNGAQYFGLVNSGRRVRDGEIDRLVPAIERISQSGRIGVCASLGFLTEAQAKRLAGLGIRHYNHNLQTSRRFYPEIASTHTYDDRLETLRHLKNAGVGLCCGALFGMGEMWADRIDLAFELRSLKPDVVPINFLIAVEGTPLAGRQPLDPKECLKIIAVFRFLLPEPEIKVAGGRELCLGDMQDRIFAAGATGFIVGNYLTTCGQSPDRDRRMLAELGLEMEHYASRPATNRPADDRNMNHPAAHRADA
jgi:biotin synthase